MSNIRIRRCWREKLTLVLFFYLLRKLQKGVHLVIIAPIKKLFIVKYLNVLKTKIDNYFSENNH